MPVTAQTEEPSDCPLSWPRTFPFLLNELFSFKRQYVGLGAVA